MSAPLPSCSAPVAPASARRLKLAAILGRALRLAVMLVVIVFGALLVLTYREMLRDTPAPSTAPPKRSEVEVDTPLLSLLRPGGWVLGDSSWTVSVADLSDPTSTARLQSLGQPRSSDTATPLEAKLLNWLHRSRAQVVGNCRVYDVPTNATRVRVVSEGQGKKERLRLVQVIWKQGNRPPQLLQAIPTPIVATQGASSEHLLPLLPGTTVLARRCEDSGALSAEVIRCSASWRECLRGWTDAGWSVQTLPSVDASGAFVHLTRRVGRAEQGPPSSTGGPPPSAHPTSYEQKLHLCPLPGGSATASVVLVLTASSSKLQGNP